MDTTIACTYSFLQLKYWTDLCEGLVVVVTVDQKFQVRFWLVTIKWFILPSSPWETNLWLNSLLILVLYILAPKCYIWNGFMVYFTVLVPK